MIGENGLILSRSVLGILPRVLIVDNELPKHNERLEAIKVAQSEMNSIVAERIVQATLLKTIPSAADRFFHLGEGVLVYL